MNEKDIFNVLKIKNVEIVECEQCNSRYTESDEQFELYEKTKLSRCPVCFNLDRLQTIYLQDDDTLEADEVQQAIKHIIFRFCSIQNWIMMLKRGM